MPHGRTLHARFNQMRPQQIRFRTLADVGGKSGQVRFNDKRRPHTMDTLSIVSHPCASVTDFLPLRRSIRRRWIRRVRHLRCLVMSRIKSPDLTRTVLLLIDHNHPAQRRPNYANRSLAFATSLPRRVRRAHRSPSDCSVEHSTISLSGPANNHNFVTAQFASPSCR